MFIVIKDMEDIFKDLITKMTRPVSDYIPKDFSRWWEEFQGEVVFWEECLYSMERSLVEAFVGEAFIPGLPNSLVEEHIWPKMKLPIEGVLRVNCVTSSFDTMVSILTMNKKWCHIMKKDLGFVALWFATLDDVVFDVCDDYKEECRVNCTLCKEFNHF